MEYILEQAEYVPMYERIRETADGIGDAGFVAPALCADGGPLAGEPATDP